MLRTCSGYKHNAQRLHQTNIWSLFLCVVTPFTPTSIQ